MSLIEQYEYNSSAGPAFQFAESLPPAPPTAESVKFIAFYLPQFHSVPENDAWWGAGFTEWTNASKALPRYRGHYQPRLPGDLGFYNLADPETLYKQAALARRGGIHGFCIHDYWFSGRKILETPLNILLDNPDIDIKFCLNWANESWSRRWNGSESDVLIGQKHGADDGRHYAESVIRAASDPRYIRIDGRPLMLIYRPSIIPAVRTMIDGWRKTFEERGLGNPYLVLVQSFDQEDPNEFGLDAACGFPPHRTGYSQPNHRRWLNLFDRNYRGHAASYDDMAAASVALQPDRYRYFPGVCPSWDNEARKPRNGTGFFGSTPEKYGDWLEKAGRQAMRAQRPDERILFINAWNEWAEGAYLEPDRHFGAAYLAETRRVLDHLTLRKDPGSRSLQGGPEAPFAHFQAKRSWWNYYRNSLSAVFDRLKRR